MVSHSPTPTYKIYPNLHSPTPTYKNPTKTLQKQKNMAKKIKNIIDEVISSIDTPWQISEDTAYKGERVEEFLKKELASKVGCACWSANVDSNNHYHLWGFYSQADMERYVSDPVANASLLIADAVLPIANIQVDKSLDAESTNPVQNAAVSAKIDEILKSAVANVDVIYNEETGVNTLQLLNSEGVVIAEAEFSGGGGEASVVSRIVLSASVDKSLVKEGGNVLLTYNYDHVSSEGASLGTKADITITVSSGTTVSYEETFQSVESGAHTLDISDYLIVGTTDIYVKAKIIDEEGNEKTKQAYTRVNVITLDLTSSYSLTETIKNGGYTDGDTIEIPFTIKGSGTKDVSLYIDGSTTPLSQTINKSGTVSGSFTFSASSLSAGTHTLQMVAERDGLVSDSIYINILKAGSGNSFLGVKYNNTSGEILTDYANPIINVRQYEQFSFSYVAYDPENTIANVEIVVNGVSSGLTEVARQQMTYSNRFIEKGTNSILLKLNDVSLPVGVEVGESIINVTETTYGLIAKFDAAGRSNTNSNKELWESKGITANLEGFNWSSNGWIDNTLILTGGAKVTIDYQLFKTDVKSTGMTFEATIKVSDIADRDASVISCLDGNKGIIITTEKASFKTGKTTSYYDEDDNLKYRDVEINTNFPEDEWIKVAFVVENSGGRQLIHLYVNGDRKGADTYETDFNFAQENPQNIVISSEGSNVAVKNIRIYNRTLSDDEELDNLFVDADADDLLELYNENDVLDDEGENIDIEKIRKRGRGVLRIVRANKLDDVYETNDKSKDFVADVYFYSPFGKEYDFVVKNCYIRIQGTSSTKYPSKNIRIYLNKGTELLDFSINGVANPLGKNKYKMRENSVPLNLFTAKSDYSDSSMSLNTGGAKLFNDVLKEMRLLTPPQQYQYEHSGNNLSAVTIRTAIDGIPIDVFCAESETGKSDFYGQYNFNNEKSKSGALFGMEGVDGFTPACPLTFETLNNSEKVCLFQSDSDNDLANNFDAGLEVNYPDDVKWAGLDETSRAAVRRLFSWIRDCVPSGADANDLSSFASSKFVSEIGQYFDKQFLFTYYLWTDYFLSVDQRAKNMLLRTWDGLKWYITYYDGDTQGGKRNDCFLVYLYTTNRNTYDSQAGKYAFEGRESWLWNLVLANFADELRTYANELRKVLTLEKVLRMFTEEQIGNWSVREYNKSGELKYIKPATEVMYGKKWQFIFALQGSNKEYLQYFFKNRFELLDAIYGTDSFRGDNIDAYISRTSSDATDVVSITSNEIYAFGYGTNNQPNIYNTGMVEKGETATFCISETYTINDPIRIYGASRIGVLDMTGAADHLKNAFDLSKCTSLTELYMASANTGSAGAWIVIDACKALRVVSLYNQQSIRTGTSSSTSLNFSNQGRLTYLDARGTTVESVTFAQGCPLETAYLPSTLKVLRLEYLAKLTDEGLTLEGYSNIGTFIFSNCPSIDWVGLLDKCTEVKYIRVTDIDMEGDGSVLNKYLDKGGVDADGNYVDTCSLVGTYQLTQYPDDETLEAWNSHYPELDIKVPPYTVIMFNDKISDPANITNLDNKTGCEYGNTYAPSGHILKILQQRHRYLVKYTAEGEVSACQLHDSNSNYFADAENIADATPADTSGAMGDVMLNEPHYWYKGVNDILNKKKYGCFAYGEKCPEQYADFKKIIISGIVAEKALKANSDTITNLGDAVTTSPSTQFGTNFGYAVVDITGGYRMVRFPAVCNDTYGTLFLDDDSNIIKRVLPSTSAGHTHNMYLVMEIPEGATKLAVTVMYGFIDNNIHYVLLSNSTNILDMEPDWVEYNARLNGAYVGYNKNGILRSISGAGFVTDYYDNIVEQASARGVGFTPLSFEGYKDVYNLVVGECGVKDVQLVYGTGSRVANNSAKSITGLSNAIGMTSTFPYNKSTYQGAAGYVNGFLTDLSATNIIGYEDLISGGALCPYGNSRGSLRNNQVGMYVKFPKIDGLSQERVLKSFISFWGGVYPVQMIYERYMDILASLGGGSSTTYYCSQQTTANPEGRMVMGSSINNYNPGRSAGRNMPALIGTYEVLNPNGCYSRLVFYGKINFVKSPSEFMALEDLVI